MFLFKKLSVLFCHFVQLIKNCKFFSVLTNDIPLLNANTETRIALVTGDSRGLCRSAALNLAARRVDVIFA